MDKLKCLLTNRRPVCPDERSIEGQEGLASSNRRGKPGSLSAHLRVGVVPEKKNKNKINK